MLSGYAGAGNHVCTVCGKRFVRPSARETHMYSHTGEKPFTCNVCGRSFSVHSNLKRHAKVHLLSSSASENQQAQQQLLQHHTQQQQYSAGAHEQHHGQGGRTPSSPSSSEDTPMRSPPNWRGGQDEDKEDMQEELLDVDVNYHRYREKEGSLGPAARWRAKNKMVSPAKLQARSSSKSSRTATGIAMLLN
jgi:transcription elongation factor Elf1